MSSIRFVALAIAIGLSAPAFAQANDPRGACKADYDKYCAGLAPGAGRIVACLNKQYGQLSDSCKKALDGRKKQ